VRVVCASTVRGRSLSEPDCAILVTGGPVHTLLLVLVKDRSDLYEVKSDRILLPAHKIVRERGFIICEHSEDRRMDDVDR
jgi:hypothetical protein